MHAVWGIHVLLSTLKSEKWGRHGNKATWTVFDTICSSLLPYLQSGLSSVKFHPRLLC